MEIRTRERLCASAFYFRLGYIGLGIGHRVYAPEWIGQRRYRPCKISHNERKLDTLLLIGNLFLKIGKGFDVRLQFAP